MKLKYDCTAYNKEGDDFTVIPKGTEVTVSLVNKRAVRIEWEYKEKFYYGYIAHRQFMICVDEY